MQERGRNHRSAGGRNSVTDTGSDKVAAGRVFVVGARGIPDVEGGAEKNAEALFPLLSERGWDVHLLSLRKNAKAERYRGVHILPAPEMRVLKTDKLPYYVVAPFHALRLKPDIVHLQGLGASIFLLVYKLLGFRVVARYGSADYVTGKWGFLGNTGFRFAEFQLRFADAVIAVAKSLQLQLHQRSVDARRVALIPNAVDNVGPLREGEQKLPSQPNSYLLVVGRVTAQKNVTGVLSGYAEYRRRGGTLELVIAGGLEDAPYVSSLKEHLVPGVHFLGKVPRSDVPVLLKNCAAYINLSIHEGHSNATNEAISMGAAVLVSDIPENRDLALPEQCYVDIRSDDQVAVALAACERNPRQFIVDKSKFLTWNQVAEQTEALYLRVLGRPNA